MKQSFGPFWWKRYNRINLLMPQRARDSKTGGGHPPRVSTAHHARATEPQQDYGAVHNEVHSKSTLTAQEGWRGRET